jgi:hypothetical protein
VEYDAGKEGELRGSAGADPVDVYPISMCSPCQLMDAADNASTGTGTRNRVVDGEVDRRGREQRHTSDHTALYYTPCLDYNS